jgi:hypothetical protein
VGFLNPSGDAVFVFGEASDALLISEEKKLFFSSSLVGGVGSWVASFFMSVPTLFAGNFNTVRLCQTSGKKTECAMAVQRPRTNWLTDGKKLGAAFAEISTE